MEYNIFSQASELEGISGLLEEDIIALQSVLEDLDIVPPEDSTAALVFCSNLPATLAQLWVILRDLNRQTKDAQAVAHALYVLSERQAAQ